MNTQQMAKDRDEGIVDLEPHFDEKPVTPFERDMFVTEEFDRVFRKRRLFPEHELMLAVLDEAVADFRKYGFARDAKGKKRFAEAEAWILANDSGWIFSFVNVCEALGLAADYLRQGLLGWKRERLATEFQATIGPRRRINRGRLLSAA